MLDKNKKIALIGTGYWGKNLLRVFDELGVLKIICDSDEEVLKERKEMYPKLKALTDFSEVLEDKDIKAVVIAAPAATHYSLTRKALEAGKDVFVEKPLALKVKEGKELVELAQKKNLILMVGHILNYHPAMIKLKEIINNKELGDIRYIWSTRLNLGKLRKEENVLWSFAPHDISVIIDILGIPKRVTAIGKSYLQKNTPDVTLSVLEFKKNQTAHIFASWLNPFKEQKLSITGSEKMAVYDGVKNQLVTYSHKVINHKNRDPQVVKAKGKLVGFPSKEPLMEEAKHFLKCIKKRRKPKTDGKEALTVLKVLDASQRSLLKNKNITLL